MKIKFLTILFSAIITLAFFSCGKDREQETAFQQSETNHVKVYFCKTFDHNVDLLVELKDGKKVETPIKKNCGYEYFQDSVISVHIIDKYRDPVQIIDDDVNNTRLTVRYAWGFLENHIGAAICTVLEKEPGEECDCKPQCGEANSAPGIKAQKIKAVYMQDM